MTTANWVDAATRMKARLAGLSGLIFVDGELRPASGPGTLSALDPSDGTQYATIGIASNADVNQAVDAAAAAFPSWAGASIDERAGRFEALAGALAQHADDLALADSIAAGLPVARMKNDVNGAINALRKWPAYATAFRAEVMPNAGILHYTQYQPYGVVGRIVAYNHPLLFAVKGCAAALIAGNCVVLKVADKTPASAWILAEILKDTFPPGVFNIVTGDASTAQAIVRHPDVRRIAFTGSARVGRAIQALAAETEVKHVSLELGGKNPMIVFDDADITKIGTEVIKGMNLRTNQGQSCGSTSRILATDATLRHIADQVTADFEGLTLGPSYDPSSDMGPVISSEHRDRVAETIERAVAGGAVLATGGVTDSRVRGRGYYVAPTLLTGVGATDEVAREEVFGPVVSMVRVSSEDELLQVANDTRYGLTASIWTSSVSTALRAASSVRAGYVWVNDSTTHHFGMPFGGWGDSGLGREESMDEYRSYLLPKSVHIAF